VAADIPGLIEGAHLGRGLGDRFLRHIERTRVLVFLIEAVSEHPVRDYRLLAGELEQYDPTLAEKPCVIGLSKIDLVTPDARRKLPKRIGGHRCHPFSGVTGEGIPGLVETVADLLFGGGHA
jgi:GTP-binding protein